MTASVVYLCELIDPLFPVIVPKTLVTSGTWSVRLWERSMYDSLRLKMPVANEYWWRRSRRSRGWVKVLSFSMIRTLDLVAYSTM